MSMGKPIDRRGSGRVRTEDCSSGKRERFAACPELVERYSACAKKAGLPPPRFALGRASPKLSEGGKACTTPDPDHCGHVAAGSKLMIVCAAAVGIIGR